MNFSLLFLSKISIAIVLVVLLYHLFQAGVYGRRLSGISDGTSRLSKSMKSRYTAIHKKYAKRSFWILFIAVGVVDSVVHFLGNPIYDSLFFVHLFAFAFPCAVFFGFILIKYTGLKRPDLHATLVYRRFFPLLAGTLATGIPLLYRL